MTVQDMQRVLFQRSIWGNGFRDNNLETKRRSAILWLRECSRKGWVLDRVLAKP